VNRSFVLEKQQIETELAILKARTDKKDLELSYSIDKTELEQLKIRVDVLTQQYDLLKKEKGDCRTARGIV